MIFSGNLYNHNNYSSLDCDNIGLIELNLDTCITTVRQRLGQLRYRFNSD